MPKKPSGNGTGAPILDFTVDALKELKGINVRSSLHDLIGKYADYVGQTKGQKPDKSAVVDKSIEYAFSKDTGFQKFLKTGGANKADVSQPRTAAAPAES